MNRPVGTSLRVASFSLWAAALGCGGGGDTQAMVCAGANVVASEKNDYTFSSTIELSPVAVAQMSNLMFDWSALTHDFEGHALDPATDLDLAIVMFWSLPLATFETELNSDALYPSDLIVAPPLSLELVGGATSAQLYEFTINTTPLTPAMINSYFDASMYPPATSTFIVGVQTGITLGRQIRMLQAFNLDAASNITNVALTDTSTKLTYKANLHDLAVTGVPAATAALTLDWSQMTTNALGHPFTPGEITSAVVGHYTQTPAELETLFLDLDRIAMATYRADVPSGSILDFTTLKDANGASFPGIDDNGTWLVGLVCGDCRNPAPWYMTILKPCTR